MTQLPGWRDFLRNHNRLSLSPKRSSFRPSTHSGPVRNDSTCRGFTLVELLAVMMIMGVLVALTALYSQSFYRGYKFTSLKAGLLTAVKSARAKAVGRQDYFEFKIIRVDDFLNDKHWRYYRDTSGNLKAEEKYLNDADSDPTTYNALKERGVPLYFAYYNAKAYPHTLFFVVTDQMAPEAFSQPGFEHLCEFRIATDANPCRVVNSIVFDPKGLSIDSITQQTSPVVNRTPSDKRLELRWAYRITRGSYGTLLNADERYVIEVRATGRISDYMGEKCNEHL